MNSKNIKKFTELTIEQKKAILDCINEGEDKQLIANKFCVSKNTVNNVRRQRVRILKAWLSVGNVRDTLLRNTRSDVLNDLVLEFFNKCQAIKIPISGPMLQLKAKDIAKKLNFDNFSPTKNWLECFKLRNNITFRSTTDAGSDTDSQATKAWKLKLADALQKYPIENQFNADEVNLYYKKINYKNTFGTFTYKSGIGLKNRMHVLLCCSAMGEKLKPLVISNSAYPSAFKENNLKLENLPVLWRSNDKSWMTWTIFEDWLQTLNWEMENQKRQIILLIDSSASHRNANIELSNVVVLFVPSNLTSVQPLTQGIIRSVKVQYRKIILQRLMTKMEHVKNMTDIIRSITELDAIRWLMSVWKILPKSVIVKSFQLAGFYQTIEQDHNSNKETNKNVTNEDKTNEEHSKTQTRRCPVDFENINMFENNSKNITEHTLLRFRPIISWVQISQHDRTNPGGIEQPPNFQETLKHIQALQTYASSNAPNLIPILTKLYGSITEEWVTAEVNYRNFKI